MYTHENPRIIRVFCRCPLGDSADYPWLLSVYTGRIRLLSADFLNVHCTVLVHTTSGQVQEPYTYIYSPWLHLTVVISFIAADHIRVYSLQCTVYLCFMLSNSTRGTWHRVMVNPFTASYLCISLTLSFSPSPLLSLCLSLVYAKQNICFISPPLTMGENVK